MSAEVEPYRVVIDEDSLKFPDLDDNELNEMLELLADLLAPLADGQLVAVMNIAFDIECWEAVTFAQVCFVPLRRVRRDTRVRLAKLLDKCRILEPEEWDLPREVRIDEIVQECSFGMARAFHLALQGRAASCLALPMAPWPAGWKYFSFGDDQLELHILKDSTCICEFWRGIFSRDPVRAENFFDITGNAFPELLFAEDLSFRRFSVPYEAVMPWLVQLLGAINDNFARALATHRGDRNKVIEEFATLSLVISPESPQTRKNAAAWAQRIVRFRGEDYLCEWHGKRLPQVDRVHFSLPINAEGGRILIGKFVDHLAT